jgi:hypothetical protein
MELTTEAKISQIIEITDHETNEKKYLIASDDEWITIDEEQYLKLIGDIKNGE